MWQGDGREGARGARGCKGGSINAGGVHRRAGVGAMQKEESRTGGRGRVAKARSAEVEVGRERERSRLSRDQRRDGRVRYRTWWPSIFDMAGSGFRTFLPLQL